MIFIFPIVKISDSKILLFIYFNMFSKKTFVEKKIFLLNVIEKHLSTCVGN